MLGVRVFCSHNHTTESSYSHQKNCQTNKTYVNILTDCTDRIHTSGAEILIKDMLISACVFRSNVYKKVVFSPAWHRQQVAVFLFCFCRFLQVPTKAENMADEFDVEAMLEAPYRNEVF